MSGSLLLIVAVWLLLMAPLLLRKQSPVRRTSRALSETRVLHEGGAKRSRRPRRLLPAEGHYMSENKDVDEDIEFVSAEPEYVLFDEDADPAGEEAGAQRGDSADGGIETVDAEIDEDHKPAEAGAEGAGRAAELETLEGELVDADEAGAGGEDHVADAQQRSVPHAAPARGRESVTIDAELADDEADSLGREDEARQEQRREDEARDAGKDTPVVAEAEDEETPEAAELEDTERSDAELSEAELDDTERDDAETDAAETDEAGQEEPALRSIPTAYFRGGDMDTSAEVLDEEAPEAESPLVEEDEESLELSEEDMEFVASRRGRGVYDPVASQKLYEQRLRRRKQVLSVLAGLSVLALVVSLFAGGKMWISFIVMAALTGVYLFNLRRQAIEEAKLRRRRLARMRRARLGVRNLEDAELGVPDRLLRPGAIVVETDEADPELENLAYASGSDFFDDGFDDYPEQDAPLGYNDDEHGRPHIRAV